MKFAWNDINNGMTIYLFERKKELCWNSSGPLIQVDALPMYDEKLLNNSLSRTAKSSTKKHGLEQ